ncbi:hypothetical protein NPS01_40420 [Nocardioides psychrotolerans]|nr:hypothetical protein NPS01_40420 [Nocardioides psychrotolerans]
MGELHMSRRRLAVRSALLSALALGLTLGGTSSVLAAEAPAASKAGAIAAAEAPPTLGTVDGKLVDEAGNPVGGIRAELFLPEASGPMDFPVATAYSSYDAQYGEHLDAGFYRFTGVDAGDYVLRFSDDVAYWASTDYDGVVTVVAGSQDLQDTTLAVAPESPQASLTGLVLNVDGDPLVGAYIELYSVNPGRSARSLGGEYSDAGGNVAFASVPTGVKLAVCTYDNSGNGSYFCQGGANGPVGASTFTIDPTATEFDFGTLQNDPLLVTGFAKDRAGAPVASGYASLYGLRDDGSTIYAGYSGLAEDGSFSLTGAVPGGRYVVCVARADVIVDSEDSTNDNYYYLGEFCQGASSPFEPEVDDFVFPEEGDAAIGEVVDPLVVLRGRLVDSAGAIVTDAGMNVFEVSPAGGGADYYGSAFARVDGSFATRLAPTDSDLTLCSYVGVQECLGGAPDPESAETFQIPVGSTMGTKDIGDFEIARRVHIRGVLTRPEGLEGRRYYPVHAVVERPDGGFETRGFVQRFAEDGEFDVIMPFTEEPVAVCVFLLSSQPCFGGATPADATYFTLPDDGSDLVLPGPLELPAGSTVNGRVLTRGGVPQRDTQVSLYELIDDNNDGQPEYAYQSDESDVSDADGRVRIISDMPGRSVTACAQTYTNVYQLVCLGGAQDPLLADTVIVPAVGETLTLPNLVLRYSGDYCDGAEIGNGTIRLGVNCEGELNRYSTGLELVDAADEYYDTVQDGLVHGCQCEGWGVADRASGTSGHANRNDGLSSGLRRVGFSSDGTGATAVVEIDEKILVTHDYQPSEQSDFAYDVNVAVENLTADPMDLAYRRVMDWDVFPTVFNELVSMHTGDVPELTFASNDGFASADPLAGPTDRGATGDFDKFGPRDQGSLLDFDFGALAGESMRELHFVYGVAPSRAEALTALQDEGAEAWTLAEPSFTEDGAEEGSPNTFFFGYIASDAPSSGAAGTNTAPPTISGTPQVGQTLTATSGTWEPNAGLDFSYRWLRDGVAITGATGSTYVLKQADVDTDISVQVTARRSGFSPARATSAPVDVRALPSLEVVTGPFIAVRGGGAPDAGKTLEVTPGEWTGADELSYSYEWRASYDDTGYSFLVQNGGTDFVVPASLGGYSVFAEETVAAPGASAGTATSNELTIVQAPQLYRTERLDIGVPTVGQELAPGQGVWAAVDDENATEVDVDVTYTWYVGNRQVTAPTFTPEDGDVGRYLYVEVRAVADGFQDGYTYTDGLVLGPDAVVEDVTVTVVRDNDGATPVANSYVYACTVDACSNGGVTDTDGEAVLSLQVVEQEYRITAFPSNSGPVSASLLVVEGAVNELTLVVKSPTPPPDNVMTGSGFTTKSVDTDGDGTSDDTIPSGVIGSPATLVIEGCSTVADPEWTVTFANGAAPMTGALVEDPPGTYTANIPRFTSAGDATFSTNLPAECGGEFSIYIDPAGVVTDQFGRPIAGATVTLLKQIGGVYTAVANEDTSVMDPSVNTANPSTTLADGVFRWDVTAGFYKVKLTSGVSGGGACATTTTSPLEVPPPRLDLLLKVTCGPLAPTPTAAPGVTGTRQVGQTLSVSTGTWADGIVQTGVQWLRDGAPIVGATGATYAQEADDAGKVITARVAAQRPDYVQENGTGEIVAFVPFDVTTAVGPATTVPGGGGGGGGAGVAPTATTAPSVSGAAKVGSTLTANPGTWDTTGLTFGYQWLRGATAIAGATGTTYVASVDDLDQPVSVRVSATKTGIPDGAGTSSAVTIAKGAAPAPLSPPLVTGVAAVGETLTVTNGSWDTEGLSFARQWRRDGEAIAGATGATYVVTAADRGSALTVLVTASKTGYDSAEVVTGAVTVPVAPEPEEASDTRTKASFADSTLKQRQRALLRVTVKALPSGRAAGRLEIKVDGVVVKRVRLDGTAAQVAVRLGRLSVGKHRVQAVFVGNDDFVGSRSEVLTLKVSKNRKQGGS